MKPKQTNDNNKQTNNPPKNKQAKKKKSQKTQQKNCFLHNAISVLKDFLMSKSDTGFYNKGM